MGSWIPKPLAGLDRAGDRDRQLAVGGIRLGWVENNGCFIVPGKGALRQSPECRFHRWLVHWFTEVKGNRGELSNAGILQWSRLHKAGRQGLLVGCGGWWNGSGSLQTRDRNPCAQEARMAEMKIE